MVNWKVYWKIPAKSEESNKFGAPQANVVWVVLTKYAEQELEEIRKTCKYNIRRPRRRFGRECCIRRRQRRQK